MFIDLCEKYGLPKPDKFSQDWIYELSSKYRTNEWLKKYISIYLDKNTSLDEKKILMNLMLDISNDLLYKNENNENIYNVLNILYIDYKYHIDQINYWSLDDEELEDCFKITGLIRKIKKELQL